MVLIRENGMAHYVTGKNGIEKLITGRRKVKKVEEYTKETKINFHGIDEKGNHTMTLVGDDQEHRINLMAASEKMYEALVKIRSMTPETIIYDIASTAISQAEGKK